jgi:long-chain acyl-CoA synthetase
MWPTHTDGEVFLPIAPFTHIYGFLTGVLAPLSACGETVIRDRFQPEHIVELLAHHRVTFFGGGAATGCREYARRRSRSCGRSHKAS